MNKNKFNFFNLTYTSIVRTLSLSINFLILFFILKSFDKEFVNNYTKFISWANTLSAVMIFGLNEYYVNQLGKYNLRKFFYRTLFYEYIFVITISLLFCNLIVIYDSQIFGFDYFSFQIFIVTLYSIFFISVFSKINISIYKTFIFESFLRIFLYLVSVILIAYFLNIKYFTLFLISSNFTVIFLLLFLNRNIIKNFISQNKYVSFTYNARQRSFYGLNSLSSIIEFTLPIIFLSLVKQDDLLTLTYISIMVYQLLSLPATNIAFNSYVDFNNSQFISAFIKKYFTFTLPLILISTLAFILLWDYVNLNYFNNNYALDTLSKFTIISIAFVNYLFGPNFYYLMYLGKNLFKIFIFFILLYTFCSFLIISVSGFTLQNILYILFIQSLIKNIVIHYLLRSNFADVSFLSYLKILFVKEI